MEYVKSMHLWTNLTLYGLPVALLGAAMVLGLLGMICRGSYDCFKSCTCARASRASGGENSGSGNETLTKLVEKFLEGLNLGAKNAEE